MYKLRVSMWALKLASKINIYILIVWLAVSALVAFLPALELIFQKEVINELSQYLDTRTGQFPEIVVPIVLLGVTLLLTGITKRFNADLIYMVMYDYFYLGMEAYIMDCAQNIQMIELLQKDFADEYKAILGRGGSLTDFLSSLCILTQKIITTVSLIIVAASISWSSFAVVCIYLILVLVFDLKMAGTVRADSHNLRNAERRSDYFQHEVLKLGTAKEIRIYNSDEYFLRQWKEAYKEIHDFFHTANIRSSFLTFISGIGGYLCIAALLMFSINQIVRGTIAVGVFVMMYSLGVNFNEAVQGITSGIMGVDKGLFALERQYKFDGFRQDQPNCVGRSDAKPQAAGDIVFEAHNVSFSYDGYNDVLKSLNFEIRKGEVVALVGSNGSGKTTLIKLLIGLFHPTEGQLMMYGRPYSDYSQRDINAQIGMVFQDHTVYHLPMRDNVAFGDISAINDDPVVLDAIHQGDADALIEKFPNGIDTWLLKNIKKTGVALSGGEKQRVAAARGYISNKPVLIFDEPAAALDPIAEMEQFYRIQEKIKEQTAILISHRVGFARLADRIFVLDDGKLVEAGSHDELMALDGVYASFFNSQAEWYTSDE